eukprot:TRINITY_DN23823_c0_g2_i1.p1 TRINITY_DN23823_c0_g2~~TRINITY_DN23823_c0_g2_i1.p1  ORF type:complete len:992 (-),score=191.06 TRINITY_DN23823_c0_g2_i1:73-3048(-)
MTETPGGNSEWSQSLKGWTEAGIGNKLREDIDATRSSTSSLTSSRALHAPMTMPNAACASGLLMGPSSSPCLSLGQARKLSDVPGDSPSKKPLEQQLKQERIWWSEQTLFEVQKMELALKQELHKTTAGIREQFKRQIEVAYSENQSRAASLERSIGRLREDLDIFKEQTDVSKSVQLVSDNVNQVETSLRLELDAMRCSLEDYHRQHNEELSVHGAGQQAAQEADRARLGGLQQSIASLREEMVALSNRLAKAEERTSTVAAEAMSRPTGASLHVLQASIDAAVADERSARVKEIESVRDETSRLAQEVAEDRLSRAQALAMASAREAGGSALAAEVETRLVTRLDDIQKALDLESTARAAQALKLQTQHHTGGGEEWKPEMSKLTQELSVLRASTEELRSQLREVQVANADKDAGGEMIREMTQLLEIECKGRKNDVEDLRQQLSLTEELFSNRVSSDRVQSSVQELDMRVQGLVNALETERVTRRSDSDSFLAKIDDILTVLQSERTLRTAEVEKLRSALAQLALNMQSFLAEEGTAEAQKVLATAIASLQRTLNDEDDTINQESSETSFGVTSISHSVSVDKSAVQVEIDSLANKLRAAQLELREEFIARVSMAVASLHGELAAQAAELRGDLAASRAEIKGEFAQCKEQGSQHINQAAIYESGGLGLQSSAAVAGQLKEVMRFMQVIASGTEHLGERICEEGKDRRRAESLINARLSVTERCLADLGANQEDLEMINLEEQEGHNQYEEQQALQAASESTSQAQAVDGPNPANIMRQKSVINDGLKDSLNKLVSSVNRMLKPEDMVGSARHGSGSPTNPMASFEFSAVAPSLNQPRGQSRTQSMSRGQSPGRLIRSPNQSASATPVPRQSVGLLQAQKNAASYVAPASRNTPAPEVDARGTPTAAHRSLLATQIASGQSSQKGASAVGGVVAQAQGRLPVTGQGQVNRGRAAPQGHPAYPSLYAPQGQATAVPQQMTIATGQFNRR